MDEKAHFFVILRLSFFKLQRKTQSSHAIPTMSYLPSKHYHTLPQYFSTMCPTESL